MQNILELYNNNGYRLVMTTLAAGPVGKSYDIKNTNRSGLLKLLGLSPESVRFVRQQHTRTVVYPEHWSADPLTVADGMIAENAHDAIAVTVGDCMPVFLYDRINDTRALLHSGWKGTGIALDAFSMMQKRYGTKAEDVTAVLGPSIGSCCYSVDRERADLFQNCWGAASVEKRGGTYYLSLKNANLSMLEKAGVREIISSDICTACSNDFGSYRREGPEHYTLMFCLSYLNDSK